ncbi:LLM class flavin-dependent oxidoreductase [bacterium]|nr:LLM class flavin-dependent oxidoreductase [bacterium]
MVNEYKLEDKNIREQIKYLSAIQGITMLKLKEEVNKKYNKHDSIRNLGNKLRNGTFRVSELVEITDILGYDIYLHKRVIN